MDISYSTDAVMDPTHRTAVPTQIPAYVWDSEVPLPFVNALPASQPFIPYQQQSTVSDYHVQRQPEQFGLTQHYLNSQNYSNAVHIFLQTEAEKVLQKSMSNEETVKKLREEMEILSDRLEKLKKNNYDVLTSHEKLNSLYVKELYQRKTLEKRISEAVQTNDVLQRHFMQLLKTHKRCENDIEEIQNRKEIQVNYDQLSTSFKHLGSEHQKKVNEFNKAFKNLQDQWNESKREYETKIQCLNSDCDNFEKKSEINKMKIDKLTQAQDKLLQICDEQAQELNELKQELPQENEMINASPKASKDFRIEIMKAKKEVDESLKEEQERVKNMMIQLKDANDFIEKIKNVNKELDAKNIFLEGSLREINGQNDNLRKELSSTQDQVAFLKASIMNQEEKLAKFVLMEQDFKVVEQCLLDIGEEGAPILTKVQNLIQAFLEYKKATHRLADLEGEVKGHEDARQQWYSEKEEMGLRLIEMEGKLAHAEKQVHKMAEKSSQLSEEVEQLGEVLALEVEKVIVLERGTLDNQEREAGIQMQMATLNTTFEEDRSAHEALKTEFTTLKIELEDEVRLNNAKLISMEAEKASQKQINQKAESCYKTLLKTLEEKEEIIQVLESEHETSKNISHDESKRAEMAANQFLEKQKTADETSSKFALSEQEVENLKTSLKKIEEDLTQLKEEQTIMVSRMEKLTTDLKKVTNDRDRMVVKITENEKAISKETARHYAEIQEMAATLSGYKNESEKIIMEKQKMLQKIQKNLDREKQYKEELNGEVKKLKAEMETVFGEMKAKEEQLVYMETKHKSEIKKLAESGAEKDCCIKEMLKVVDHLKKVSITTPKIAVVEAKSTTRKQNKVAVDSMKTEATATPHIFQQLNSSKATQPMFSEEHMPFLSEEDVVSKTATQTAKKKSAGNIMSTISMAPLKKQLLKRAFPKNPSLFQDDCNDFTLSPFDNGKQTRLQTSNSPGIESPTIQNKIFKTKSQKSGRPKTENKVQKKQKTQFSCGSLFE